MLLHTFIVAQKEHNQTLAAVLRGRLELSWTAARRIVLKRQVRVNNSTHTDPATRLRTGARIEVHGLSAIPSRQDVGKVPQVPADKMPKVKGKKAINTGEGKPKPPPEYTGPMPKLIYFDDSIVIADKPPGLTTVRHADDIAEFGEGKRKFLPTTLADLLPPLLGEFGRKSSLRAVHRIDRDTSGLVVFARTADAEAALTEQFRKHTIDRRYIALVRGTVTSQRIESVLVKDRGDGRRGSTLKDKAGQRAVTHVKVVETLGEYTLVECRLETGRTHQVRIHLGEKGAPLCGEKIYDRELNGPPLTDASGSPRIFLHAARLGLQHPEHGGTMQWESSLPDDLAKTLARLRLAVLATVEPEEAT